MDSGKVNQMLTLGANFGVLIGIILILIELNQNADLMRAQMTQERANHLVEKYDAIIHSDFWPAIAAKRAEANSREDWIAALTPEEYQRVLFTYYRDINDVANQFYQYQQGYLPQEVWDNSSKNQIERLISLAADLGRKRLGSNPAFREELRRIADEEGLPYPDDDGVWK